MKSVNTCSNAAAAKAINTGCLRSKAMANKAPHKINELSMLNTVCQLSEKYSSSNTTCGEIPSIKIDTPHNTYNEISGASAPASAEIEMLRAFARPNIAVPTSKCAVVFNT